MRHRWLCEGWELSIPEHPELLIVELDRPTHTVLQSWLREGLIPLCRTVYPGIVYDVYRLEKIKEIRMGFISRSLAKAKTVGPMAACADLKLAKEQPALFEFLTCTKNDDGSSRRVSTITLYFDNGQFKAFLNDKDSQKSLCVVAPTVQGLLIALEASVTSDEPQWRDLPQPGAPKRPGGSQKKT